MIISYLTTMTLCASLLLIVYSFLLEKERMHHFKRFYLMAGLVVSLLIPFVNLEFTSVPFPVWNEYMSPIEMDIKENFVLDMNAEASIPNNTTQAMVVSSTIKEYILLIYILVASLLLLRYLYSISQLLLLVSKYEVKRYKHAKLVLMDNKHIIFSFWKYIFIQKNQFYNGEIKPEILSHELAHVHQKHTLDILFMELMAIVFWFNPIVYLYKRSVRLNHEFLADEEVVKKTNTATTDYQLILLNEIKKNNNLKLASYFNYLLTKKRFIMMTKKTSLKTTLCKGSIGLLAMIVAFCFFSVKIEAQEVKEIIETGIHPDDTTIIPESGITAEEMDTYKRIVDKYFDGLDGNKVIWKSKDVSEEDWKTLYTFYLRMTKEQRKEKLHIYFAGPLVPKKLRCPNKDEWYAAKGSMNKKIWLDGKEVTSEELNSYNRRNIAYFIRNHSDYSHSYLWTKSGIEEYQNKYKNGISQSELFKIKPQIWFTRSYN